MFLYFRYTFEIEPSILRESCYAFLNIQSMGPPRLGRDAAVFCISRGQSPNIMAYIRLYSGHLEDGAPILRDIRYCFIGHLESEALIPEGDLLLFSGHRKDGPPPPTPILNAAVF
ncbi:hypothetical protein PoB_001552000 [Plakobranchus ocellatus]|uniref:Uncharacterized protein n=1 Tax=Plakobranchus ocellatus TaxID=259542 RepID=A0AAV3Z0U7_9GAST|nr:hypothetical protein PoB_001552000 [Plakobranchus ocellatus]